MVIWRGMGILVWVVVFGFALTARLVSNALNGASYWAHNGWPFAASLLASGVTCWLLGKFIDRLDDRPAGEKSVPAVHTFLFVPVPGWSVILMVAGLIVLMSGWKPQDRKAFAAPAPSELKAIPKGKAVVKPLAASADRKKHASPAPRSRNAATPASQDRKLAAAPAAPPKDRKAATRSPAQKPAPAQPRKRSQPSKAPTAR